LHSNVFVHDAVSSHKDDLCPLHESKRKASASGPGVQRSAFLGR
jgi:hypothetical protein